MTSPATRSIEPRTGQIFPAAIASADWYLWDNVGYVEAGQSHIYAQAADRASCAQPEDRYWQAYWRHFVSIDGGRTWVDEGPAICPSSDLDAYDARAIWSGSVLVRSDGTKMAAYTGLAGGKLALQSIAVAVSRDGYRFERVSDSSPLLSAAEDYDRLVDAGYYLGPRETLGNIAAEADGTYLSLRDPFLFVDAHGAIHVFFGAKAVRDQAIVRAVGHAVFTDREQLRDVEIRSPIFVPDGHAFNQLELPNMISRNGSYYLVVSTTQLAYLGQSDLESSKAVRVYRSNALDEGWEPYGSDGEHIILAPDSRLYGLSVFGGQGDASLTLTCRAFRVGETSLPPSVLLSIGGSAPRIDRPSDLWSSPSG